MSWQWCPSTREVEDSSDEESSSTDGDSTPGGSAGTRTPSSRITAVGIPAPATAAPAAAAAPASASTRLRPRPPELNANTGCAASALSHHRCHVKRILDREAGNSQSKRVYRVLNKRQPFVILLDLLHTALQLPFVGLFFCFLAMYVACFVFFAAIWWLISEQCGLNFETFVSAISFSAESQMSIGFGAPSSNFNGCDEAAIVLPLQLVGGFMLDAAVIGIMFAQISAANAHAASVMFSDTALLREVEGCVHLSFRIAKRTGFMLSQGKIQVYCVQHLKDPLHGRGSVRVEVCAMNLAEPDMDLYNGVFFLGLPCEVVHRVDFDSPLAPDAPPGTRGIPSAAEVQSYLRTSKYLEILVMVSGIEQTTASSFEARHSYTLDDIFWNRTFRPCVSINAQGYHCVDLNGFHQSYDVDEPSHADDPFNRGPAHSFPALLDDQVADWTIYARRRSPRPASRLEDLFTRMHSPLSAHRTDDLFFSERESDGDTLTRQTSITAGESPSAASSE
eukprot:TRINITY_DN14418_c0_g1_i1.p1 TRINITY_DN14418_c0_g1~~TRINITY_DN14418_c0_g1_i1.p1  ORF type:complete len:506 (+),score=58.98 TRINITY_DN14418_c0_g1_i1:26-1543(+)